MADRVHPANAINFQFTFCIISPLQMPYFLDIQNYYQTGGVDPFKGISD